MEPVLNCSNLKKHYGERQAVNGLSFTIGWGETYGLLGPNGAGKTTTLSMLCGLVKPDLGSIQVLGHPMGTGACIAKTHVGYVPQEIALFPDLTCRENLMFFGRLQGLSRKAAKRRVVETLEMVELMDRVDERVGTFSGGMKRRANIACGLLHEPALLVLDEPTVGVDPQSRNAILENIAMLAEGGLAVLYTTHYMEEARRLCDRIGIVDQGSLVAEGTQEELLVYAQATAQEPVSDLEDVFLQLTGKSLRD